MSWVMLGRPVDRRFNRARCNAAQSIAACTAQPEDTVDPDPVRGGLAGALRQRWNRRISRSG